MSSLGLHIEVRGTVQGVGYRPFVYQAAHRIGIGGRVWNHPRGVSIEAHGPMDALAKFVASLRSSAPPAARVTSVVCTEVAFEEGAAFVIDESAAAGERRVSIPADLATCDDCLRELFDPADRRYRYPFTNCTNCGPRYSIVRGAPYDRANTSMAPFPMCERCQNEYDSPLDRRFHAQPNACPDCGPKLTAVTPGGQEIAAADPIHFAARAIRAGLIVALKGLGGFHLACDATSETAVRRLRGRKHRETKPFAIMVPDLAEAERLAALREEERALLGSSERPIVLAQSRDGILRGAQEERLIGLFLPYTPLHHLLLRDTGVPLVMTSGNVSDEPMATTNEDALAQLGEIADLFLLHEREIVTRVDDSIVRVLGGAPTILRRSRGYVPRAIETGATFDEPILACGAHLKNTFAIAAGNSIFPGPHIGDLENLATFEAYETAIARMKDFLGVWPRVVVHDLHPDYLSTRYALAQTGARTIGVQHHHAHVASVMAEHDLDGPVLGIAYDGTGSGTDGTSWGGEFVIARGDAFERVATFRPIALAGGDAAIRQPWRTALALLDDAYDGRPPLRELPLFRELLSQEIDLVRQMIAHGLNTTPARGVGRYFDAIGALVLGMPVAHYEGEVAFRWNMVARDDEHGRYPIVIRDGVSPWEVDPRTIARGVVDDLLAGVDAATISARFHNTLAEATIEIARATHGGMPIVLSGGCFANARLAGAVLDGLQPGARVFTNRNVPPGDGGIALGQIFVAAARLRAGAVAEEALACA
ncbi:MAG TPA: carbamoyltransferase HypF [Thermoanaerobaculia bacterium]|nr:carbamoyltransferase HypF [Thermoanaerobaculia bacterium]